MLVITRRVGESLLIGDDIRIHITKIARNQVGIAIDAPKSVKILREELTKKAGQEKDDRGNR